MNRKYIGLGIIFVLVVTIILCIFLIPSASNSDSEKVENPAGVVGLATTFAPPSTSPQPFVTPVCSDGAKVLYMSNVTVNVHEFFTALTGSCAGIEYLHFTGSEIVGLSEVPNEKFEPLPKVTLSNLRRLVFERLLFPYTRSSIVKRYIQNLTQETFQNDLVFLNTKKGESWSIGNLSTALDLECIEIKVNGIQLLVMDRTNGIVQFNKMNKPLANSILSSVEKDPAFVLRHLIGHLSNLDVDLILPGAQSLTSLNLYYTSLFSTSDPNQNLHTFIPRCSQLMDLHLHLYDPPFTTLDTSDLVPLTNLTKFSFQYGGRPIDDSCLTHVLPSVTLPNVKYVYVATEWAKMDPRLIEAIPTLFQNLETIIFNSYNSTYHYEVLYQLLKMPSLLSISFYSFDLFPVKETDENKAQSKEELKTFLRHAGITPGIHDFILTRTNTKDRWQGREVRYFEKEGYSRIADE